MYLTAALISQVSAFPLAESSGDSDDLFETSQVLREPNLEFLALHIRSVAVELRDRQLCDFFSLCDGSMSLLQMYNMQLPQLTQGDRCYRRSFRKKTCLTKIVKSLYEYKSYLQFVKQGTENEKHQVDSMLMSMENLADLLQSKIHQQHEEVFIPDMLSKSVWNKQVKIHVILRNFALFMESTIRAIRFIK
ncbi:interleukin-6-like [Hypanus sabinus]|uniref:interleukin-6-like n=1 Tax=Hypanus sabinus TaxID=79690 RepID=UPI0028C4BCA6|nr:interleukin-6-like [Hypanus sabinus]